MSKRRMFSLTRRHAQIPLAAFVILLLVAGAFAWQGSREEITDSEPAAPQQVRLAAPEQETHPVAKELPDFVDQVIFKSSPKQILPASEFDSKTALEILTGANAEAEENFLPALARPDEKRLASYQVEAERRQEDFKTAEEALSKSLVREAASTPRLSPAERIKLPAWRRYAALSKETGTAPIIAIVIDDLGHTEREFTRAMALGEGITLAILPYTDRAAEFARRARDKGFEILVHMPMEPTDASVDPGPNALLVGLSETELMRRLVYNLSRLEGYVGINNHMGSKFSQDRQAMKLVLDALDARGLLYLDSVTIGATVGGRLATASHMPFAERDVFLDSEADTSFIEGQLRIVEKVARQSGHAVAIGHPYAETMEVLKRWLPEARKRGFEFVPISTVAALECAC